MIDPVSPEEESFEYEIPENQPARQSKYFFAAGKYRARCVDIESGETKNGDKKVVLTFMLLEGPGEGTDIKAHLAITANAFWKLEQAAQALEVPYDKSTKKLTMPKSHCVNRDVILDLKQSKFQGRDRMEIGRFMKPEGGSVTAL